MKRGNLILIIFVVLIVATVFARLRLGQKTESEAPKVVREPVFAGTWYPGSSEELNTVVQGFLQKADRVNLAGKVHAVIVPHAGYAFSGQVAANSFKQLDDYRTVIVLGTSHHYPLQGADIPNYTDFRTPLGDIKLSSKTKELMKDPMFVSIPEADSQEHSIEIELPFLQKTLSDFELVPIIVGNVNPEKFKTAIDNIIDDKTLIVVSVDMSHYHPYADTVKLDNASINSILALDAGSIFSDEIDSPWAVASVILLAKEHGWTPHLIKYANSGDVTGDKTQVVGYSAIVFTGNEGLNDEDQKFLLELARKTLQAQLGDGEMQPPDETKLSPALLKEQGCFVTLNEKGNLRGCIGHIVPQEALYKCVIDNAVNAALHDSRFTPVQENELKDIAIEISVLTVPEKLEFSSADDLKNKLVPLRDGVVLKSGWHGATFLPQVWEEIPDKEEFLANLCQKGGASRDCWKDTSTEVYTYHAQVFAEK